LQAVEPIFVKFSSWWVRTKLGRLDEPQYQRPRSTKRGRIPEQDDQDEAQ
jgi:hypothetical protein